MSFRIVNGSSHTEDGWRCCNRDETDLVRIPDLYFTDTAPLRKGPPLIILGAWLYWYDRNVEEILSSVWGWSETNDVLGRWGANNGSNHLSATAVDVNAPKYPWGTYRMTPDKIAKVEEGLRLFEGSVFWGRRWSKPDEMHYQMAWKEGDPRNEAFAQKLLNGHLGIYLNRPPRPLGADILARATNISLAKAEEILPDVSEALRLCNCTNPRRIAAALAQWVIESGHFVYTEEIQSGPESEERWKYKGRTWIQLTWLENYLGFSRWCHSLGLVPTPTYFGDHPKELAQSRWRALGPAYWWAVKYPQINEYADRGDIDNVSKWVNAPAWVDNPNKHANHEAQRRAEYNRALAVGDQLLLLLDDQPLLELDDWEALMASTDTYTSRSPYRDSNDKKMRAIDALFGADSMDHADHVERAAYRGEPWAIERVARTAAGQGAGATLWFDPTQKDQWAIEHAQRVLADIERVAPDALRLYLLGLKGTSA